MCDVLPVVLRLSRIFQMSDTDLTALHKHVSATNASLSLYREHAGPTLSRLDSDLLSDSSLKPFDVACSDEAKMKFQSDIQCC